MDKALKKTVPARDPVGPFLHYLMAECGVSPHTLAAYRSDLMRFIRWRKSKAPVEIAKLDAIALSDYVVSLHCASLSPSSICRHLASLSTFFRFLVLEGRVERQRRQALDRARGLGSLTDGAQPRRR